MPRIITTTRFICVALLAALALNSMPAQAASGRRASGTISIDQGQAGFIVTAGFGGGVLKYKGKTYRFKVGGLGLGGMGISSVQARGTVYDLSSIERFPGTYISARTGAVVGKKSFGKMWLKNESGVFIELVAKRKGLMLTTGADGVVITMR